MLPLSFHYRLINVLPRWQSVCLCWPAICGMSRIQTSATSYTTLRRVVRQFNLLDRLNNRRVATYSNPLF